MTHDYVMYILSLISGENETVPYFGQSGGITGFANGKSADGPTHLIHS